MADTRADELTRITAALFTKKAPWDQLCQEIAEKTHPLRTDFTTELELGTDFNSGIMDSFGVNSRETLGNAIDSMLRQGEWFAVGTGEQERDERPANAVALASATRSLQRIIRDPRSRFASATKEADHDWVAFGNPVLSVEESPGRDYIGYRAWHPKLCAWMTDESGQVNANHRRFKMQARNIKAKFKTGAWKGQLHRDIDTCCETEPMREFPITHILMPIEDIYGDDGKKLRQHRHKFISLYIDETHREILNELGSKVFNYVIPRWRTFSNHPQGFSPAAINSMPDLRMLQAMALVILEQGEKAVDPPMVGSIDVFKNSLNIYAGGFTSVDLEEGRRLQDVMQVIETGQGLQMGLQLKQDVRMMIAEAWLLNKLYLPSAREMTAYETGQRVEEFRRAALPFFTPIDSEYHSPLLGTTFEMGVNMGIIDATQFPEELQDEDIAFTFTSPLKDAEGQKIVAAYEKSMQLIAAGAQVEEGLADQFDVVEATIDAVRGTGARPTWVKPEEERKKKAAQNTQVADLQRSAQLLQKGAGAVSDVGNAKLAAEQAGLM